MSGTLTTAGTYTVTVHAFKSGRYRRDHDLYLDGQVRITSARDDPALLAHLGLCSGLQSTPGLRTLTGRIVIVITQQAAINVTRLHRGLLDAAMRRWAKVNLGRMSGKNAAWNIRHAARVRSIAYTRGGARPRALEHRIPGGRYVGAFGGVV